LLAPALAEAEGIDWDALRADVSNTLNNLGNALDDAGDKAGAIAAFERAIALQPDFAMWRRNRAGMLIELRRLDDAEAEIAAARVLEPDAPRLAELDADLEKARAGAPIDPQEGD
jgi:tetratricopeptide (TPR) repeat protein